MPDEEGGPKPAFFICAGAEMKDGEHPIRSTSPFPGAAPQAPCFCWAWEGAVMALITSSAQIIALK